MIEIRFPDQSVRSYPEGITPFEVAQSISEGLARNVLSAKFNSQTVEVSTPLNENGAIQLFTWNEKEGKTAFWHSSAHVLAQALLALYPNCKLTIGPAIENGFYYDADFGDHSITEKDLVEIEQKMLDFARQKFEFKMRSASKAEALAYYQKENNPFKMELIENLEDGTITFCDHADFTDLCRGGHIPQTGVIKAVKLTNVAGAYWRGDETKPQLTRIYGISFPKQKELTEYLEKVE
jgi:threonyl-tRNA synthetase